MEIKFKGTLEDIIKEMAEFIENRNTRVVKLTSEESAQLSEVWENKSVVVVPAEKMEKVIEINKDQLCDLCFFFEEKRIRIKGEAYCTSVFLESNNPVYGYLIWDDRCTSETFKTIVTIINSLIISGHKLVFKEEK